MMEMSEPVFELKPNVQAQCYFPDLALNGKPISTLDNFAVLTKSLGITPSVNQMNNEIELLKDGSLICSSQTGHFIKRHFDFQS